jgi:predicted dehydrogenase
MNTRRHFIKQALTTSTAIGFPSIIPSSVLGKDAPSNKITVGFIGTGSHGIHRNLNMYLRQPDARVLAVCDVFRSRREKAKKMVDNHNKNADCTTHNDFREILARKDIDTVMISTPDHWHTLMSLMALRAGKDVQCEKPTLTIAEGRLLADTVKARKAVFQTSTEDRSMRVYHRLAELVRNGRIGKLKTIRVKLPAGNRWPTGQRALVPDDLDYDLWLGPAPEAPYTYNVTEPMRWRQIWDYSGGLLTDWGAHQLDTAQWANDTENTGPVSVEGKGTFNEGSIYNTAINYKLKYTYANGVEMHVESGGTSLRFEGTDGWVGNSGWARPPQASSKEILESKIGPEETHLFTCKEGEHRNFLDCVKSRKDPYLPAETGHRLASLMHMGNISMRLDRKLQWNPEKEAFVGDKEANAMRSKPMRKPWSLES